MFIPKIPLGLLFEILLDITSDPWLLNPRRLIKAWSFSSLKILGLGLPNCLLGVTVPTSINPKTGNSFPTEVLSASVLAETCMIADAYATALMVMPFSDSMALIESESNLEAYWIIENEDGGVEEIVSSGFPSE